MSIAAIVARKIEPRELVAVSFRFHATRWRMILHHPLGDVTLGMSRFLWLVALRGFAFWCEYYWDHPPVNDAADLIHAPLPRRKRRPLWVPRQDGGEHG